MLRWVTGRGASVRPEHLGGLTVSMLEGEHGRQQKEVEKLVQWLERDIRPDVVHLNKRTVDRRRPANYPPAGRAGRVQSVGRG